ncbi:class C sortase [Gemelliphila palaticanis]|uniref:Class C sortase n=1 Tax=Gemelliphila palaticanis TaxID=81950 RepID=A0ABX2SXX8_9BACL|nr:class C sortase [Gemella palaticanis]MBF0715202.1 class C sortase [Gemella palaticanis]NYS47132.1 class C sortase [Gemella palaticanis]
MEKISNNKKRKLTGYVVMIVGILLPLYSLTSISYNEIKSDYNYKNYTKSSLPTDKLENLEKATKEYNNKIDTNYRGIIDPFAYSDYKSNYNFGLNEKDMTFGYLQIPKIDLAKPILLDSTEENLSKGLAHVDGTNLPVGGETTRSVIAGHRGWYQDVMFLNLNFLEDGDKIYLTTIFGKKLSYTVTDKEIITPYEWEKLKPKTGEDILTLLTCDPISPNAPYRLIVNAKRDISEEKSEKNEPEIEKNSSITLIKYSIYFATIFLWGLIIFIIRKIIKNIRNKD